MDFFDQSDREEPDQEEIPGMYSVRIGREGRSRLSKTKRGLGREASDNVLQQMKSMI